VTVILTSLLISTSGSTQENNLFLPEPELIQHNGKKYVGFDAEGYSVILKLYGTYQLQIENRFILDETIVLYQEKIELTEERNKLKEEMINFLTSDRNLYYSLIQDCNKEIKKIENKNKIKIIVSTVSGVLLGVGTGILIGVFI